MTATTPASIARPFETIPMPKGYPFLGSMVDFMQDPHAYVNRAWQAYGDMMHLKIGPRDLLVASHPDIAEEILLDLRVLALKPAALGIDSLSEVLGSGLVTNHVTEDWIVQRRMIQPMFHRRRLATMVDKMSGAGERMLARWETEFSGAAPVDVSEEMMRVTLDIVTQTMFSTDVMDKAGAIGPAVSTAAHGAFRRGRNPFSAPLWVPFPSNRRYVNAIQSVDDILLEIIAERRESGVKKDDLLDMLLEARDEETGEGMSDQQLRDEVVTIFAAGHETTSHALTWTLYLLSLHQDIQAQLRDEVDTVLNGRTPTLEDLKELPLTSMALEESMRVYPPVPIIPRAITQPCTIAGYNIPEPMMALISVNNIHRHPDFWDEPDRFKPERFTPEAKKGRHRHAYMPFGAGQRQCIGNHFALMEGQLLLAMMLQQYRFTFDPTQSVVPEVAITLRSKYGMRLFLKRRNNGQ